MALITTRAPSLMVADVLGDELRELSSLRAGLGTPLDEVDRLGEQLLARYQRPQERGRILYGLLFVHSQSGIRKPEQLAKYAKEAVMCPLDADTRIRTHVYWGDALRVNSAVPDYATRRQEAAKVYLEGLKFLLTLDIAVVAQPQVSPILTDPKATTAQVAEARAKDLEHWKAWQESKKMAVHRPVLIRQIRSMYQKTPYNQEELAVLANSFIDDQSVIDEVVRGLRGVAENPKPSAIGTPEGLSARLVMIVLNVVVVIMLFSFWIVHRWRGRPV